VVLREVQHPQQFALRHALTRAVDLVPRPVPAGHANEDEVHLSIL
jgi:hypothetical protein